MAQELGGGVGRRGVPRQRGNFETGAEVSRTDVPEEKPSACCMLDSLVRWMASTIGTVIACCIIQVHNGNQVWCAVDHHHEEAHKAVQLPTPSP